MPITGKLTALKVAREKRPGLYGDGGGLYLQVSGSGAKSWVFRFWVAERDATTGKVARDPASNKLKGRSREMGLGSFATISLAEARDRALECRKLREKDIDPIEAREAARREAALQRAKSLKFKDAAEAYMAAHRIAWKNDKHAAQWPTTLKTYAYPVIGELPLQLIETTLVMKVIEPLWSQKPRKPAPRSHRVSARLGHGAWLSPRRKSGALARPSRPTAASAGKSAQGQASQFAALCRTASVPGKAA